MDADLLTVKEGAAIYNPRMRVQTFREKICPILAERHGLRVRVGMLKIILIIRVALEDLIESERGQVG